MATRNRAAKEKSMTAVVRAALLDSGKTFYVVSQDTGLSWKTVKRFSAGENIRSDHLDELANYFGLVLVHARQDGSKRG